MTGTETAAKFNVVLYYYNSQRVSKHQGEGLGRVAVMLTKV